MNDQEHQHIHCPVTGIVELLLLDGSGDGSADGVTFQNLKGWNLIDTYHPDALFSQTIRIPIAPKDLRCSFLEPGIQASGLPIAGALRLQIDIMQDAANRCRTNRSDYTIVNCLASQVLARPVGDV